jgi:hypothetical protein
MIIIIIILVTKLDCVVLCFVFHRLVYPMLPVSLDCPFLITHSVFSNIYLIELTLFLDAYKPTYFSLSCIRNSWFKGPSFGFVSVHIYLNKF